MQFELITSNVHNNIETIYLLTRKNVIIDKLYKIHIKS